MACAASTCQGWLVTLGLMALLLLLVLPVGQAHARDGGVPPTQARSLSCLYQALDESGVHAKYPDLFCRNLNIGDPRYPRAISRTDLAIEEDGVVVAWLELLSKERDVDDPAAPIDRRRYEIRLRLHESHLKLIDITQIATGKYMGEGSFQEVSDRSRISGVIYEWLSLFESSALDHREGFVDRYLSDAALELEADETLRSAESIFHWLSGRVSSYSGLRQRVGKFEFVSSPLGVYQVQFVVDWKARKQDGTPVVGRQSHHWSVEVTPRGQLKIKRIQVHDLLPLPDMATRFFC